MHGTVPIVRTVAAAISPPPSRIPHINFHILQRRGKPRQSRRNQRVRIQQSTRLQSTIAHSGTADSGSRVYDGEQEYDGPVAPSVWRPFRKSKLQRGAERQQAHAAIVTNLTISDAELDDANIYALLEQGNADFLQLALGTETIGTPFIRHAPDDDFDKALLALDPTRMVEPQINTYRHRPRLGGSLGAELRGTGDITQTVSYCQALLRKLIYVRRSAGKQLTLTAYRHLMRWAASFRDHAFAEELSQYMTEDGVQLDLDCHNYSLEAKVWNNALDPLERLKLRVYPFNSEIRSFEPRPEAHRKSHQGHTVASANWGTVGLRREVLQRFQWIVQSRYTPNEATFVNVMIAMGREGDLEGVHSILKSVWNIDMVSLQTYGEEEIEAPTFYDEGTHLRPSQKLLYAIVHIFGSNNDVHTAWTLLDYISRSYNLSISQETWNHLLEWHLVLSCDRSTNHKRQRQDTGYIKPFVFERLFAAMLDQPYNIQPDAASLFMLSRVRETARIFVRSLEALELLRTHWQQTSIELKDVMWRLRQQLDQQAREIPTSPWNWTSTMELRQEFLDLSLKWDSELRMLQHAVAQHVLRSRAWQSSANSKMPRHWEHRWIPAIIEEYQPFVRGTLIYEARTGAVALREADALSSAKHVFSRRSIEGSPFDREVCRLRKSLQETDYRKLFKNIVELQNSTPVWKYDNNRDDQLSNLESSMLRKYNPNLAKRPGQDGL